MATRSLSTVATGIDGFKILGENPGDQAGDVATIGDLDGDGHDEVVVGAFLNDPLGRSNAGAAYVVFGGAREPAPAGGNPPVSLATITAGVGGFKILGEDPGDQAGNEVSSVRDMSGDGLPEVLVSAPENNPFGRADAGAVYVVFGRAGTAAVDLRDVADAAGGGFKIRGQDPGDQAGRSLAPINDQNQDGRDEVLVGAPFNDPLDRADAGAVYVVFGQAGTAGVDLRDIAAGTGGGFKILGETAGDEAGIFSVAPIGDLSGDGLPEILVGAPDNDPIGPDGVVRFGAGAAYVVFGKTDTAPVDLRDVAAGMGGFKILGEAGGDLAGVSVGASFDLNSDRLPEILVGAPGNDPPGRFGAGAAYVVFGQAGTSAVDLRDVAAPGGNGVKFEGEAAFDAAGFDVSVLGDLGGDGRNEILIGALNVPAQFAGAAYAVFF
jgi:hypothetical protein